MTDSTLKWTEMPDKSGVTMSPFEGTWADLIDRVRTVGQFPSKDKCPWLKLATFGDKRSAKGSLRHNDNLTAIFGIEGDYDAGEVTLEVALERLEDCGIRAALYPSASSTPEKPRWRVLCPLSTSHSPQARQALVARLNGALCGVLTNESYTLSQGYFFGAVPTNDYRVLVTWDDPDEGTCIDELVELDANAICKPAGRSKAIDRGPMSIGAEMFEEAVREHGRLLKAGDGRREMLKTFIASRSARGAPVGDLRAMIKGLAAQYFDPAEPMDEQNIDAIICHFKDKDNFLHVVPAGAPAVTIDADTGEIHFAASSSADAQPEGEPDLAGPPLTRYPPPFRGVMRDVVEAALPSSTKPQPDLCTLSALIGMAASCNGIFSLPSGMRLNLYGCGVAGTGEGKDHPRSIAMEIAKATASGRNGKPASGAGLEDCLMSYKGTLICLDEIAHFFSAINNGKAPPHLIELAGLLLQLFSVSSSHYITRVRAVSRDTIPQRTLHNPVVSILGFATPEKLGEAMGVSNVEDGLLGRMLVALGQEGVVPRRVSMAWSLPESVVEAAKAVIEPIPLCATFPDHKVDSILISIDAQAEARLAELLGEFDQQRRKSSSAFAKALLTRSCEKCERVAGVLAVWDCPRNPVITLEHVTWAEQLLRASDAALLHFSGEYMHGGQTQADANKVLIQTKRALNGDFKPQKPHEPAMLKGQVAPYSMVMRASKLDKRRFDDAVAHLEYLSEVVLEQTLSIHPNGRNEWVRGLRLCE